jgi:hypothetical protein
MTASLLGHIAAHHLDVVAAPPVVTPKRVGKPVSTIINTVSSITAALPQTPTAGNLLIAIVTTNSPSTTPTCTTPAGWTPGPVQKSTAGTSRLGHFTFWKLATGGEANPAFTFNVTQQGGVVIQEWAGLDPTAPHLADSAGAQVAGSGTFTLTDALTTTTANEWVFSTVGVNVHNTLAPITWTLPQLSFDAATNTSTQVKSNARPRPGRQAAIPPPGSKAPQAVATVGAGTSVVTGIVSMSFKIASGSRPQVVESVYSEYSTAVSSWAATLATTPDPADVLICAVLHNDTLGAPPSVAAARPGRLKQVNDTAGKFDLHVWTGINPTSAGPVTVTSTNARTGKIRVLRASGVGQAVSTAYSNPNGLTGTGPCHRRTEPARGGHTGDERRVQRRLPDHQRQPGAGQLGHRRDAEDRGEQRHDAGRLDRTERPGCLHRDRDVGFRAGLAHRDGADRIGDDEMTDVAIAPSEDLTLQIPVTDADGNPVDVGGASGEFLVTDCAVEPLCVVRRGRERRRCGGRLAGASRCPARQRPRTAVSTTSCTTRPGWSTGTRSAPGWTTAS